MRTQHRTNWSRATKISVAGVLVLPALLVPGVLTAGPAFATCQPPDQFDTCSTVLRPYVAAADEELASAQAELQTEIAAAEATAAGGIATVSQLIAGASGTAAGAEATAIQLASNALTTATMIESQLQYQVSQAEGQALAVAQTALATAEGEVSTLQSLVGQLQNQATAEATYVEAVASAAAASAQQTAAQLLAEVQAMSPVDTAAEPTLSFVPTALDISAPASFDTSTLSQDDAGPQTTPYVSPVTTPNPDNASGATVPLGLPLVPLDETSTAPVVTAPPTSADGGLGTVNSSVTSHNPTVHAAFNAATESGSAPSDSNAAAGPNEVVETINDEIQTFSKTGKAGFHTTLQNFFGTGADNTYDPHIVFERNGNQFLGVADDNGTSMALTVSKTASMSGPNCRYNVPVTSSFADYPQIGYNSKWVYVTYTIYKSTTDETETDSQIILLPRSSLESCSGVSALVYKGVRDAGTGGTFSGDQLSYDVTPATEYDTVTTSGELVDAYPGGGKHVTVFTISSDGQNMTSRRISSPSYSPAPASPQPGTSGKLDMDDPHTIQAINSYSYGLYTSLDTGVSFNGKTSAGVLAMRIDNETNNESVLQSTTFGYPGDWFGYPAVGPDSNGNATIVYTLSGSNVPPAIHYAAWALGGGLGADQYLAGGGSNTHYTESFAQTKNGSNVYRWGDYSSVVEDPTDFTKLWICAQNETASSDRFGTSIAELTL